MPNRLAGETSAYLLQHAENPVDWYPWGPEAWARAIESDRPVLVSIGYSSCHWCHVMEHESFEDEQTAELMNRELVCIKVDREERPDVDQIYMETIVRLTGSGGWPLNVFCTPDGRPFFGGTYFPPQRAYGRASFSEIVLAIARTWRDKRDEVLGQAGQITEALQAQPERAEREPPGTSELTALVHDLMRRADREHGGFGAAPKFPTPTNLEALLYAASQHAAALGALEHVVLTCKRMARGGLFDQLAGGFHRYSTDARWLVPHFEKMLYDQGQLLRVYAEARRQTGDDDLVWPVEETVVWLEREMRSPEGGFFASQDADSEGEEGKFYVWDRDEVTAVLGSEDGIAFCEAYGVEPGGTFEHTGKSVLEHALAGARPRFAEARSRLLAARGERIRPPTDEKQITSWIAYTVGGLATAAAAFDRDDWRQAAERAADFLLEHMRDADGRLLRIFDGGRAHVPAFLDDHAALLCALLDLHRAGAADTYLEAAIATADAICTRFYAPERGDFFFAAEGDPTLPFRPGSDSDGATPGAAGLATLGLARVAALTGRSDLDEVVRALLLTHAALARRVPAAAPTLLRAGALVERGLGLGLVLGERDDERTRALAQGARALLSSEDAVMIVAPGSAPAWLDRSWLEERELRNGAPTAYVCRGRVCSLPANAPGELSLPAGA